MMNARDNKNVSSARELINAVREVLGLSPINEPNSESCSESWMSACRVSGSAAFGTNDGMTRKTTK